MAGGSLSSESSGYRGAIVVFWHCRHDTYGQVQPLKKEDSREEAEEDDNLFELSSLALMKSGLLQILSFLPRVNLFYNVTA